MSKVVDCNLKERTTLLTWELPSSRPSSCSSAEGLAPGKEREFPYVRNIYESPTDIDIRSGFDSNHLAVDLVDDAIDLLPESL